MSSRKNADTGASGFSDSDSKKKNNFVQRIQRHTYSTENLGEDFFRYIRERIADKATRKYSGHNVHLCVLCLLDLTDWVLDKYGSVTYEVADWPRRKFFDEIRAYLKTKYSCTISTKSKWKQDGQKQERTQQTYHSV